MSSGAFPGRSTTPPGALPGRSCFSTVPSGQRTSRPFTSDRAVTTRVAASWEQNPDPAQTTCALPGNVSQLHNVLERAVVFSRGRIVRRQTVQDVFADLEHSVASIREQREALEHQRLVQALHDTGGNISQTAEQIGMSRAAGYRRIHKHGIPLTRRN